MNHYLLCEDKLPPKLYVTFSWNISKCIEDIEKDRRNNDDALLQWADYLEVLKHYISNPVIAYDYNNRYQHYQNGAIHLKELGFDVSFIVKIGRKTNLPYVYIFDMKLNCENYGLINPFTTSLKNNINGVSEDFDRRLNRIITETLNRVIRESILAENRKRKVIG